MQIGHDASEANAIIDFARLFNRQQNLNGSR
jgi:hypothetical protein